MTALPEPINPAPKRDPKGGSPAADDPRRCQGHKTNGDPCPNWALKEQRVCGVHGGNAPQARRKAQLRLLDMIPVATKRHREILRDSKDERVVLQAVKMVYDRTGLEEGSASAQPEMVREMVATRILDLLNGRTESEPEEDEDEEDEDIVDAELVEDENEDPWDLL